MGVVAKVPLERRQVSSEWKIAIVQALFNQEITQKLTMSAKNRLLKNGMSEEQIAIFQVPGALEVPLALSMALKSGYHGAIATGAVVRGDTTHYEYVCNGVERGCTLLQLETQKPIAQAVLTTENQKQALDRCGGVAGDKGAEAADVLLSMLNLGKVINPDLKSM